MGAGPSPAGAGGGPSPTRGHAVTVEGPEPGIELTTLDSGLRVVTERMPEARSVTIGVLGRGRLARRVRGPVRGVALPRAPAVQGHRGAQRPRASPSAVDAVGGEMNAFTTREHTSYYTRLPAAELDFGLDLLADVISAPAFRPHEVDAEREVILEEILMNEDTPDDVVHTRLMEALFPDHGLGAETLGSEEIDHRHGARRPSPDFHGRWYRPANLVVAAAGDLDHDQVVDGVAAPASPTGETGVKPERVAPGSAPRRRCRSSTGRPSRCTWPWPGGASMPTTRTATPSWSPTRCSAGACRADCSRRSARNAASPTPSTPRRRPTPTPGRVSLYAGTAPARLGELLEVVDDVIDGILAEGITEAEHDVARGYLEGATLLGPRGQRQPHGPAGGEPDRAATRSSRSTSTSPACGR